MRVIRYIGFSVLMSLVIWAQCLRATPSGAEHDADAALLARLQHSAWVAEGAKHPRRIIYAVVDPNCPFCHDLWQAAQPLYKSKVQIRYLLVGFLAANSPGKAAAILEAKHPAQAWDWNESHWAELPGDLGGGICPLTNPKPSTLSAIMSNEELAQRLGIQGTPALIYADLQGQLHMIQGANAESTLQAIAASH